MDGRVGVYNSSFRNLERVRDDVRYQLSNARNAMYLSLNFFGCFGDGVFP